MELSGMSKEEGSTGTLKEAAESIVCEGRKSCAIEHNLPEQSKSIQGLTELQE